MASWLVLLEWLSKIVLFILLGLSIWSVAIMVEKGRVFARLDSSGSFDEVRRAIQDSNWDHLPKWAEQARGPKKALIQALLSVSPVDASLIDRTIRSLLMVHRVELEKGLTVLATLGSNSPFIGLFGTVLGIIHAFGVLGLGQVASSSSSATVMQGVSEALIATAIGLLVAIPAVIAYNLFSRRLKIFLTECDSLKDLYIVKRSVKSHS